jgi:hypothetical protein
MKSNIQLSWQSAAELGSISDLVIENKSNSINSSGTIIERTWQELYWLKNLGRTITGLTDPVAYNCGFYLDNLPSFNSLDISLHEILTWSSIIDDADGLPCGVFTIFGFDSEENSYIEKYLEASITAEEMYLFSHNWIQGQSRLDQVPLDTARRYLNTTVFIQTNELEGVDETFSANTYDEKAGILRVLVLIRVPSGIEAKKLSFIHKIGYDEKA